MNDHVTDLLVGTTRECLIVESYALTTEQPRRDSERIDE